MGQRLVLAIKYEKEGGYEPEDICNCYMHWAGYTGASLECTRNTIDALQTLMQSEEDFMEAIHNGNINVIRDFCVQAMMASQPGAMPVVHNGKNDSTFGDVQIDTIANGLFRTARLMEQEIVRAKNAGEDPRYSRNDGLIGYDQKTIDDLQSWSEGDANIFIDSDGGIKVYFGVAWVDEYKSQYDYQREGDEDKTDEEFEKDFENSYYHVDDSIMKQFEDDSIWDLKTFYEFDRIYNEAYDAGKYMFGSKTCNGGNGLLFQGIE